MTKNAEILVEQFDKGITTHWSASGNNAPSEKCMAITGEESECLGKQIWADIKEIIDIEPADKVLIKLEYQVVR